MKDAWTTIDNAAALVQCVPNFSEGRRTDVLERIAHCIGSVDVRLVDWSADVDHNRSVFTFVGSPQAVMQAAVAAATQAIADIDISVHQGVHPRLGVLDVLPFVPLQNISVDECGELARDTAKVIVDNLGVPVFFYEAASPGRRTLPFVRKHAFVELDPDLGPPKAHPTAGAIAVGARGPLIAFNINLREATLSIAQSIATEVRSSFRGKVRALGLELPTRGIYQVSMNIIKPGEVTMSELCYFVGQRAEVLETELIGAMPGYSAFATVKSALKLVRLRPGQVLLESWRDITD